MLSYRIPSQHNLVGHERPSHTHGHIRTRMKRAANQRPPVNNPASFGAIHDVTGVYESEQPEPVGGPV